MFHKLFYTCEHASMVAVKKADGASSTLERIRLWVHIQVCEFCKIFELQNRKLNSLVDKEKSELKKVRANAEAKQRWKDALLNTDSKVD